MLAGEYSINAKLLYGLLLNRTMLSQKSGWVSEDGDVYVIYTIKQMANDLDRSERTVKTALRELENTEYKEHSKTERVESTRRRYGEFQNVFLSGEECTQLETAYPGKAAEYIERLSRYMASNDRHYANHYATIKKWLDEDSKGRSAKNYTYDDNEGECL